jgi:PLP dependent protein
MSLSVNYKQIANELTNHVQLIAVSKTKPESMITELYELGHLDFGENKVQELVQKAESLPKDIRWHMIGHLQRNKVKFITPFVYLIHGVDSHRLLAEIDKRAAQHNRVVNCLLQVHIAKEETKFGFNRSELLEFIASKEFAEMKHVSVRGLMGMATYTDDESLISSEFSSLKDIFDEVKSLLPAPHQVDTLSMGMTNDYLLAIKKGSTMVRIGSAIFGERGY